VCAELTPANRDREIQGVVRGATLGRTPRRALILTLDQRDRVSADGMAVTIQPAWEWMSRAPRRR
jgi:hypothetical protein